MARAIPIIRFYDNLLVSIQMELSDAVILELKDELARETVVAGLTAGMGITLVEMDMDLIGVHTTLNLDLKRIKQAMSVTC